MARMKTTDSVPSDPGHPRNSRLLILGPLPFVGLLLARRFQVTAGFAAALTHLAYGCRESAGGVSSFFHERFVFIQGFVTGGVGFVVADVAIEQGFRASFDEFEVDQPVGQRGADAFGADGVAVGDDGEDAAFQMFRVIPAF